ncbi:MAG: PD-(D/E)XK nuclease family protein [Rhodothermus sp.]|nr:PD-(D/E)XK nuclease family protein [Rhodothermus sp.]
MIRRLPIGAALIPAVLEALQGNGRDWSRNLVIFPGRRPAHFLRKALVEQVGGACIGPEIWAVQDWIDHLARELLPDARWLEPIDAVALLFEVHQDLPRRYGHDRFNTLARFFPLGLRLLDTLETLHLGEVAPAQLRDEVPEEPLADYYERFYEQLSVKNYWTRASRIRAVAERFDAARLLQSYDRIVVAGLYAFSAAEARLFRQVLAQPQAIGLFLNGPGLVEQLRRLGLQETSDESRAARTEPIIHLYQAPDRHGQVLALAEKLRAQHERDGLLDERTVVVLPAADALFPVLRYGLAGLPDNQPYNVSLGYPLDRTPVVHLLHLLTLLVDTGDASGSYAADAYLQVIRHPYLKNIRFGQRTDVTRILMHTIEEHLMRGGMSAMRLEDLEATVEIFQEASRRLATLGVDVAPEALQAHLCRIHDRTIRSLAQVPSLAAWARWATEVVAFLARHSTAPLHPYFAPFAERLIEMLEALARSRIGHLQGEHLRDFWQLFEAYLRGQRVPFAGTPLRGLQVLGLLETRGLQFDTVYVLDVNEEVLPEASEPDPLLPDTVRRRLGLETASDRQQLTRYYFENLTWGAREVHLFYTEHPRQGERSRFVEQWLWKRQQRARTLDERWVQHIGYSVSLTFERPQPVEKTEAVLEVLRALRYSPTLLDTYLTCPLQFYYRAVLNLRAPETLEAEPDRKVVGQLVHRILQRYCTPFVGRPLQVSDLDVDRLRQTIEDCFTEAYGTQRGLVLQLLQERVQHWGEAWLCHQRQQLDEGPLTMLALEQRLEGVWGGFSLEGYADRIDRRGDRWVVLDYKTGRPPAMRLKVLDPEDRTSWARAIGSFQLPIYRLLYAQQAGLEVDCVEAAYVAYRNGKIEEAALGVEAPAQWEAVLQVLQRVLAEIQAPDVPFRPTEALEQACPRCPYRSHCGTQWVGK